MNSARVHSLIRPQYVTNQATRIIIRAAGELASETLTSLTSSELSVRVVHTEATDTFSDTTTEVEEREGFDIDGYRPSIRADRSWSLSEIDLGKCELDIVMYLALTHELNRMDRGRLCRSWYGRRRYAIPSILDGSSAFT